MPLSEKARIEVFLPDIPDAAYQDLFAMFEAEFAYAFGGCTVIPELSGTYVSENGTIVQDRVNLLFADTGFDFKNRLKSLSSYAEGLRQIALDALDEEAILVVVSKVYHSHK